MKKRLVIVAALAALGATVALAQGITTQPYSPSGVVNKTLTVLGLKSAATVDAPGLKTTSSDSPVTITGNRAAGSSSVDVYLTTGATRSAGYLFALQNYGTTKDLFDYGGNLTLGTTGQAAVNCATVQATTTANTQLALKGNVTSSGSATGVVIDNAASLASGDKILAVKNAGTEKLAVDYAGSVTMQGGTLSGNNGSGLTVYASNANNSLTLKGYRNAADTALTYGDVHLASTYSRTAGIIVGVSNNGTMVGASNWSGGVVPGQLNAGGITSSAAIYSGTGAPSNSYGANGDFYFRTDTPGSSNQRLYVKSGGSWVGIL